MFHDITPTLSAAIAVFPGDTPFQRLVSLDFRQGHHLLLSSINTTLHVGAHADAPNHYHPQGDDIAARSLRPYMGRCQVVTVSVPPSARIYPSDLADRPLQAARVLFRTGSFPDPHRWNAEFNALSPELIHELADRGVILVGIDTPSIDPETSKLLESHQAVYQRDLAVLEGIVLADVPDGLYTLIALPLKIAEADASPVRAILLKEAAILDQA